MFIWYILSVCFTAALDVPLFFETGEQGRHPNCVVHMLLKVLPTAAAAVFSLFCCINVSAESWRVWLTVGLMLGTIADGLLEVSLYPGGVAFALGHISYIVSFTLIHAITPWSLLIFLLLCLLAFLPVIRMRKHMPKGIVLLLGGLYGIILLLMLSTAISLLWTCAGVRTISLVVGCVLFAVSDLLLLRNNVRNLPNYPNKYISLFVYYLAQLTIALSAGFTI